jgi:hypothetical protein
MTRRRELQAARLWSLWSFTDAALDPLTTTESAFATFCHGSWKTAPQYATVSDAAKRNAEKNDDSRCSAVIVFGFEACRSIHLSYGRNPRPSAGRRKRLPSSLASLGKEAVALSAACLPRFCHESRRSPGVRLRRCYRPQIVTVCDSFADLCHSCRKGRAR